MYKLFTFVGKGHTVFTNSYLIRAFPILTICARVSAHLRKKKVEEGENKVTV